MPAVEVVCFKTKARWDILKMVHEHGVMSINEIMRKLNLARSTVALYLGELEELGLIENEYKVVRKGLVVRFVKTTKKGEKFLKLLNKVEEIAEEIDQLLADGNIQVSQVSA